MKPTLTALFMSLGLTLGLPAWADAHAEYLRVADSTTSLSEGTVKKVDKAQGKLTLRHGPLENLDMPGMTMVFRVKDPKWLDQVKPGDNIRFLAEKVNGEFTVTRLETVQ
ncbi:MAG: copper-binding protein [Thiobacillus sp.]|uniref:copper-binding protein n=1 Tax=Thiobacillus sp. TaxID=924 RepID=UPI00289438D4|nr:copper-binding protein [Thiobacillus sp.]MDT3706256.1 copper-binding protein [Thiobacillus sp.]